MCNQIVPQFGSGLNDFNEYVLQYPLAVKGTIYIGMTQTTDDNLNVGFDRNTDSHLNIFYNSSGYWQQSFKSGSLMIRPVFGMKSLSVNNIPKSDFVFKTYPNPLNLNNLTVELKPELNKSVKDYTIQISSYRLKFL